MDIKVISSLNTEPLLKGRWGVLKFEKTIYMTALSLMYANLWYSEVEFFTDDLGYELFKDIPVNISLLKEKHHKDMWMGSKFEAMKSQKKPFIHIDTDVFLKKKLEINSKSKVIVERIEYGVFDKHYKEQVDWFSKHVNSKYWIENINETLNCGTVGFLDIELKDQFLKQYKEVENIYIDNIEKYQHLRDKYYEPCIVVEQYNLTSFLKSKSIKPNFVLKGRNLKEQISSANKVGYTHLYGKTKYTRENEFLIKELLLNLFPETYYDIKSKLEFTKV